MLKSLREARKNESGFTLIELLIVIVILGVLAGVVVFAVGAFNNDGKAAACKADYKNVEIANEAYFAKTGGYAATPAALKAANYLKDDVTAGGHTITITGADVKVDGTVGSSLCG